MIELFMTIWLGITVGEGSLLHLLRVWGLEDDYIIVFTLQEICPVSF